MTGMITVSERPMARHSGFGMLSTAPARMARIVSVGEKRHRHNLPIASAW